MLQARTRLNIPHCFIEQVEELCNIFVVVQIVGHGRRGVGLAACTARWEGLGSGTARRGWPRVGGGAESWWRLIRQGGSDEGGEIRL